ncbi:UDP-N-acetylglucosamine 1-carboxyvinyltransferase [Entomospira nematocerorum]|uniref:UDP-N-acetylglucosamine 1-carboxyvinyltransferase n=1 Tax=Entomospira nematocerorum TaxID=2719987 RepID=A0A968GFN6_9SPIO|nr:UDP-N-acetylglucosamine 1-carboxyvinyltransferase [Entomospira nematocera]NIZ47410.1 UDP-N-acetylglucosamine 1-carboxyvinyltransferase [Entomospira nematocera]WDI34051.1 UDP-N-acetylglucosamine 1-carboxyvinyltransferase [Entomospira nematocera]
MKKYVIEGGHPLSGTIKVKGNKNAALPCIAASLLTDKPVILRNIPEIADVLVMFEIIEDLGGSVTRQEEGVFSIHPAIGKSQLNKEKMQKIRAGILFAGPILARKNEVSLPPPGGDVIGRRRLDTHFLAFEGLGAQVHIDSMYHLKTNKLVGSDIFLDEASVTATENAIMAASLAQGTTILRNAASEPHVQDLCHMINSMGGKISGIGSNVLSIEGVTSLDGCDFTIGADFMEVGSFIALATATKSALTIENVDVEHLRMIQMAFAKLGITWETEGSTIHVSQNQSMKVRNDLGGAIPTIDDAPWPGFPADLTSIMVVAATQCEGTVLIHEKMYESRMFFVDKLISMGAGIILCDPHRAVITGNSRLTGADLASPDVRAGMAMVIAALAASGTSTISNVYQIERGYENIVNRLQALGANIRVIEG